MTKSIVDEFSCIKTSMSTIPPLHYAVLLSPLEVDVAFRTELYSARRLVLDHWMLTGVVSQSFFDALRLDAGRDITGELAVVTTTTGASYLIVCSELGDQQHRHVLPLYENKVAEFLRFASREPFRMFIESANDGGDRLLYTSPLFPELFVMARDACKYMDVSRRADFMHELPRLIAYASKPETMRSIRGTPIREVNVSIFMPTEATTSCLSMDEGSYGSSANCH